MTHAELNKMCQDFDKMYAVPMCDQMDIGRMPADIMTMRINLEIATQLAWLNEQGTSLAGIGMRGSNLCVSIEQDVT